MRINFKFFFLFISLSIIWFSCSKEKDTEITVTEKNLKEDTIVSIVEIESFAQSIYIDLLGRKATRGEIDAIFNELKPTNASRESRYTIIQDIIGTNEYYDKLYLYNIAEYLNGADENTVYDQRLQLVYIKQLGEQDNNQVLIEFAQNGINRLDSVIVIPERLKQKVFSEDEMQKRLANNAIYDDINMGVPNFTFSIFESFLFRAPTNQEWQNAQNICNTIGGVLFGINGQTKPDFLDIIFSSDHYFEGKVINAYLRFVERRPNSLEQYQGTVDLIDSKDFQSLYLTILSSDEYFER